ncbi:putative toxin-antitoxin system toxin component, PIN family [Geotalea uraniireducens]|uniref:Nucleotide binding protein, PINc n=1 Tax=Geotalea uraniireducens (strain Rf4) TaxID=351605 RepID=A5GAQ1_GEOUR|nr:putative toxin-antitoxin system toxin component, PIN family [Geotalea uraniireducens]ABQ25343.1 Nucleotide binding protein, PINc [Geotalea uraniireducens Rf4]
MVRVVLDANQFVSALLKPGSNPDAIMRLVREEKVILLLSETICDEILRVLTYPKIRNRLNRSDDYLADFVKKLRAVAVITPGTLPLDPIKADADDTKYLVCAIEGKADFIVSGDRHLKDLKSFQGIRIVDPATFLAVIVENSFGG